MGIAVNNDIVLTLRERKVSTHHFAVATSERELNCKAAPNRLMGTARTLDTWVKQIHKSSIPSQLFNLTQLTFWKSCIIFKK